MNVQHCRRKKVRDKTSRLLKSHAPPKAHRFHPPKKSIGLVCAHFSSGIILAIEQHLRAEIQIRQRAEQLWQGGQESALENWIQAEGEVVNRLCAAFEHQNV